MSSGFCIISFVTAVILLFKDDFYAVRILMLHSIRRRTDLASSTKPTVSAVFNYRGYGSLNSSKLHEDEEVQTLQDAIVNVQTVHGVLFDDVQHSFV